jgi:hypothetical protein
MSRCNLESSRIDEREGVEEMGEALCLELLG